MLYCAYVFHQLFIFVAYYLMLISRYLFVHYLIIIRLIFVLFLILNRVQVFRSRCMRCTHSLLTITIIKSSQYTSYSRLHRLCLSIGSEGPITTIDITG
jgi:hypothetical protein